MQFSGCARSLRVIDSRSPSADVFHCSLGSFAIQYLRCTQLNNQFTTLLDEGKMMTSERLFVASADGHVGLPTSAYRPFIPSRYHDDFDEYLAHHEWLFSPTRPEAILLPKLHDQLRGSGEYDPAIGSPVVWDPHLRLRAYDEDGIAAEVLIPDDQNTNDPPWGSGLAAASDPKRLSAGYATKWVQRGAEAYNRWLAEFCSADQKRFRGLTILGSLENVAWAITEIKRAYEQGLTTGIVLPLDYSLPLYHHPRYDRLWAVVEEMDLTVVSHVSRGHPEWVGNNINTISGIWVMESDWYAQRPLWCLTLGGILERHPKLRLVIAEVGVDWVAPVLSLMDAKSHPDTVFKQFPDQVVLSMRPSEYFQRQCFVAHSSAFRVRRSHLESNAFNAIPNMIWGSDFGHGEGFWPSGLAKLHKLVSGLNESEMRRYLGADMHRAFPAIRRSDYEDVIDRIGPTGDALGLLA
jgi:predicted TIM-barrel fold metal-dependent hydrolase